MDHRRQLYRYSDRENRRSRSDHITKVPTLLAIYRVILRSIKRKRNKATRPDMPHTFSEKLDSEYIEFLSFVLHYKKKMNRGY